MSKTKVKEKRFSGILAGVLLVLILLGGALTFTQLSKLEGPLNLLTGAATSTGTGETNLTITATTSLTNQNFQINFGNVRVNQSCNYCGTDSNGISVNYYSNGSNLSFAQVAPCCIGPTSPTTSGFLLENTGNVNVSVGYTCSGNCTHSRFIGGNRYPATAGLSLTAIPNVIEGQTGEEGGLDTISACQGGGTFYRSAGWNITNASAYGGELSGVGTGRLNDIALSSSGHWLCGNYTTYPLMPDNERDAGVININITIPADALGTGVGSAFTMTFNATSSG